MREKGIKVIALLEDTAASGGLYIAMGADYIISHPGTVTGSIGVIMKGYEISHILKQLHIGVQTIRSGEFKDIGSMFREMTPREQQLLQGVIDNTYMQFVNAVASARKLPIDKVKQFADGRIMTGQQAFAFGLVDGLGSFEDAVELAERIGEMEPGEGVVKALEVKDPFLKRLGLSLPGQTLLDNVLPEASLPNVPLWMMPRF